MSNHHEVKLHLAGGSVVAKDVPNLRVGDTVSYSSPDGKVRVVFPLATPYDVSQVEDDRSHQLKIAGLFAFQCFITPAGQAEEVGWSEKNPDAGGEHRVHT